MKLASSHHEFLHFVLFQGTTSWATAPSTLSAPRQQRPEDQTTSGEWRRLPFATGTHCSKPAAKNGEFGRKTLVFCCFCCFFRWKRWGSKTGGGKNGLLGGVKMGSIDMCRSHRWKGPSVVPYFSTIQFWDDRNMHCCDPSQVLLWNNGEGPHQVSPWSQRKTKTWWKVSIWFRPMGTRNPWTINPESLPLRSVWFLENSDFIRFQACPKAKTTWSHFEIPQKIGVAIFISLTWYILNLPPTQDASSKWRFDREFLKKY